MIRNIAIITVALSLFLVNAVSAGDRWDAVIKASVLTAENKLVIGQRPDATDYIDGRYDIPALLGGDIKAYIELEGNQYWKEIKELCSTPCKKTWNIIVESEALGEVIELSWNSVNIPNNASLILIDTEAGKMIDMSLEPHKYTYRNPGRREFMVEVQGW